MQNDSIDITEAVWKAARKKANGRNGTHTNGTHTNGTRTNGDRASEIWRQWGGASQNGSSQNQNGAGQGQRRRRRRNVNEEVRGCSSSRRNARTHHHTRAQTEVVRFKNLPNNTFFKTVRGKGPFISVEFNGLRRWRPGDEPGTAVYNPKNGTVFGFNPETKCVPLGRVELIL